ncbi:uncharacterized protein armh4 isoform X2 [Echeneis naucrates]|uniref:uncharacterized protein armh4 isoform X2 n=1 Tax=Echeneis naucrates TaxID=173247 RepID=UPI0011144A45|nr:armadillo-like helical domain-containing protein 4 isoform X2 [Echeneis naucrates]
MPVSGMLHRLLLAGTCLCVCGTPVHLSNLTPTQDSSCDGLCGSSGEIVRSTHTTDIKSKPSDTQHVTGLILNVGVGGGAGPHVPPEGIAPAPVTQTGNGDSLDERSGRSEAGEEAWGQRSKVDNVRSSSEMGDAERQLGAAPVLSLESESPKESVPITGEHKTTAAGGEKQLNILMSTSNPGGFRASARAPPQLEYLYNQGAEERTSLPGGDDLPQEKDPQTRSLSFTEPPKPSARIQTLTSHTPIPSLVFASPRTSTSLTIWGHDGATESSLPDPLLPEIGPNLMPREDGPESVWTEAVRPGGVDTVVPLSQDEATDGTMSSEALPLIFEPFEDIAQERAAAPAPAVVTLIPSSAQPPAAMVTGGMPLSEVVPDQLVTAETDNDSPSHTPSLLMPDWTSPWQTSGAELLEPIGSLLPSVSQQQAGAEPEDHSERVAVKTSDLEGGDLPTIGSSLSSFQHTMTTVTMKAHQPVHKSRSGLEEMESEEEPDEDEDDENSEESVEEESEEDLTDTPKTSSTQPPYSLIPPPPVWVQRNQGLMRSWVELIREKAGYVSGMLAPVGIGITGALLIVGALYSIRMIHRKRRNSFKHQRRKQPREPGTSRQDQAMLLADSSEDEF